jgi:transposase InsO family protein
MMMAFIDAHREDLGIEPICHELAIAPSSYHEHAARLADPGRRSARARRDDEMRDQIRRVHEASHGLYGTRKVWHQLRREGVTIARCTVERLMSVMGLAGEVAREDNGDNRQQPQGALPARQGQPGVPRHSAQ